MRLLFLLSTIVCLSNLGRAQEAVTLDEISRPITDYAFFEISTDKSSYFVHEPIRVTFRFGFDTRFLDQHLIAMFRRPLDLPVQIQAPWLKDFLDSTDLSTPESATDDGSGLTFALNGNIAEAQKAGEQLRDARPFTTLEFQRETLSQAVGELVLELASLEFSYATSFGTDFLGTRTPANRYTTSLNTDPLRLLIEPLPVLNRPAEFSGAVGSFTIFAGVDRTSVPIGDALTLTLTINGSGNWENFSVPNLEGLTGFHVRGRIESQEPGQLVVNYELETVAAATEVAPIPFSFFDVDQQAYRVIHSNAIPMTIRGVEPSSEDATSASPDTEQNHEQPNNTSPSPSTRTPRSSHRLLWLLPLALAAGTVLAAAWFRTRRHQSFDKMAMASIHNTDTDAEEAFREAWQRNPRQAPQALLKFLSRRLQCSPAAVVDPNLTQRMTASGFPQDLAHETATYVEAFVASQYGGQSVPDAAESAVSLVQRLSALH